MFEAAMVGKSSTSARDQMITLVHNFASDNSNTGPFATVYDPSSGAESSGVGSPAVGAMAAPLALKCVLLLLSTCVLDAHSFSCTVLPRRTSLTLQLVLPPRLRRHLPRTQVPSPVASLAVLSALVPSWPLSSSSAAVNATHPHLVVDQSRSIPQPTPALS